MSRIFKRPATVRDLVAIAQHIRADNEEAAERFLVAADETFHRLAVNPTIGRPRHFQRKPGCVRGKCRDLRNTLFSTNRCRTESRLSVYCTVPGTCAVFSRGKAKGCGPIDGQCTIETSVKKRETRPAFEQTYGK